MNRRPSKIHEYAAQGDLKGVQKELRQGVKVDARDDRDLTPLAAAAKSPDAGVEMLQLLLSAGANINAAVDSAMTFPLALAAGSGDLAKVHCLLDAGANVNAATPHGYTPLIMVFSSSKSERLLPVIDVLVKRGADIDALTSFSESPLTRAIAVGAIDALRYLLDAGAKTDQLIWTPLMMAIVRGNIDDVRSQLGDPQAMTARDSSRRTPWLLSALVGEVEKAKLLRAQGVDLEERGWMGDTALATCARQGHLDMARWLIEEGADVNSADDMGDTLLMSATQAGHVDCVELLLSAGADLHRVNEVNETAIALAEDERVARLLFKAGASLDHVNKRTRRLITGLKDGEHLNLTRAEYLAGRYPHEGISNPEKMDVPFWREMVRAGITAYQAKVQFDDVDNRESPVWCFDRFGTSLTELPDGRFVQIGGEHEDFYDRDFYIYNDIVVHEHGGAFQIYGYPRDLFPPTDFHTATYVDGCIYIIGSLSYTSERKFETTPVYRLDCKSWKIERIETTGDAPGWIHKHKAVLIGNQAIVVSGGTIAREAFEREVHVANTDQFQLDLSEMKWSWVG
jgi:ankyrin repeat protein